MDSKVKQLKEWIDGSDNIVFFGGAGVSTESGLKDFRSVDGLYHLKYEYPPEIMLSHSFFEEHPDLGYEFYKDKILCPDAQPNMAHKKLAELEKKGKLKAVITQNIDGLHQKAGSENVLELHGSQFRNYCKRCGKQYDVYFIQNSEGVPHCDCGGIVRADVVLYEEALDPDIMQKSVEHIAKADVLIVGGTSLAVYPAAGLISYYRGGKLVLINRDPTPYDDRADLVINDKIGEVMGQI